MSAKTVVNIAGTFAVGWITNNVPIPVGIGFVSVWSLALGYQAFRSETFRHHVWRGRRRAKVTAYIVVAFVGATVAIGLLAFVQLKETKAPPPKPLDVALLKNGGFESDAEFWGTGSIEERIKAGNHPSDLKRLPYVVGDKKDSPTASEGHVDRNIKRNGHASYRFDHAQPANIHRWGSLSQRVHGIEPDKWYSVVFYVHGVVPRKAFFVTTDIPWNDRTYVPAGTHEWQHVVHKFFSGKERYVDVRFVVERSIEGHHATVASERRCPFECPGRRNEHDTEEQHRGAEKCQAQSR